MDKSRFKAMWESMQREGYFNRHPHYTDFFGTPLSDDDLALDAMIRALDFTSSEIFMPVPYSAALERAVKRTEPEWLPKMFDLPVGGTALDVGCGFGRSINWLAKRYETVIGTDISSEVITLAQHLCGDLPNVRFYTNEADSLPAAIVTQSVDIAYVFTVFQHIPREFTAGILQQINKVLKPGGMVVFNLITSTNESLNDGEEMTEWAIGYSHAQARDLVAGAGMRLQRINKWGGPGSSVSWLWVLAEK